MWGALLKLTGKVVSGPLGVIASWLLEEILKRLTRTISKYFDKIRNRGTVRDAVKDYEESKTPADQERTFDDLSQL